MLFPQNAFSLLLEMHFFLPYVARIAYRLQLFCALGLHRLDFSLLQVKDGLSPKYAEICQLLAV